MSCIPDRVGSVTIIARSVPDNAEITGQPIPGGTVRLWLVDTDYFKDLFHCRMQIKAGDPGALYLHSETYVDYAKQIVAEEKKRDRSGKYSWQHVRGQNHYFDAEVYASAMVDPVCFGGLGVIAGHALEKKEKKSPRARERRPGFIAQELRIKRSGWLNSNRSGF